jgi:TRAP-type uncharacterized transport system fused permease subunit
VTERDARYRRKLLVGWPMAAPIAVVLTLLAVEALTPVRSSANGTP